jgi:hypothetical protein
MLILLNKMIDVKKFSTGYGKLCCEFFACGKPVENFRQNQFKILFERPLNILPLNGGPRNCTRSSCAHPGIYR